MPVSLIVITLQVELDALFATVMHWDQIHANVLK